MGWGGGRSLDERVNVHVYPSPIRNESRILRIATTLVEAGVFERSEIVGRWEKGLAEFERLGHRLVVRRIGRSEEDDGRGGLLGKIWRTVSWSLYVGRVYWWSGVACVNCHSLAVLPLCVVLKHRHRARLVYDTHELETETIGVSGIRRWLAKVVERALIIFVDEVSVVSQPIAWWYESNYGISNVHVVRNLPVGEVQVELKGAHAVREAFGIGSEELLFLYQGLIGPGRSVRLILEAFAAARPDQHVVFLGYGPLAGVVEEWAKKVANIHFHPAVNLNEVLSYTAAADVGFALIEDVCLSYRYCLPNKLFEYLRSGVPCVVSDLPALREVVEEYECGWVVSATKLSLRSFLGTLTKQELADKKAQAERAAMAFDWSNEVPRLLRIYEASVGECAVTTWA